MSKLITYFTPTFNRAHLLPNLYKSLCNQSNKEFIWLIVDDGSTDGTKELVESWQKESKLEIEYIYKENGGKNTAMDLAHQRCTTRYINAIDSDDYITEDCTDLTLKYIDTIDKDESVCGIVSRRADYKGVPNSENWPKENEKVYFNDLYQKMGYTGETSLVFKTEIVKNFHFPSFEGEKFVTESVLYNQFMYDYKMLAIKECVYLGEYQVNGYTLTGKKLFFKNPKGFVYSLKQNAFYSIKYRQGFINSLKRVASYMAWKKVLKTGKFQDYKFNKFFAFCGWCLHFLKVSKYKKQYKEYLKSLNN